MVQRCAVVKRDDDLRKKEAANRPKVHEQGASEMPRS
jgi:hypothetical protein